VLDTFDYADLNSYLLLVIGVTHAEECDKPALFNEIARKARSGQSILLKEFLELHAKQPFVTLPHTADLTHAVEMFGSGIHRIIVVNAGTSDVIGVLTQLRLVRFFWQNGRDFKALSDLYHSSLQDLSLGSRKVVSIKYVPHASGFSKNPRADQDHSGDRPLTDALEIMNSQSITSLPVVDNHRNVVGNISQVDTRVSLRTYQHL